MDSNFTLNVPINGLSFGQVAINILQEIYKQELQPAIIPVGQGYIPSVEGVELQCYGHLSSDFIKWIDSGIKRGYAAHSRKHPCFRLWHINDSLASLSERQVFMTFHETDTITPIEKAILGQQTKVLVTTKHTEKVFTDGGLTNVNRVPLGFDTGSFYRKNKKYFPAGVTCIGIVGKLEYRKRQLDLLRILGERFGNNKDYFINCALFNQHLPADAQGNLIGKALKNKRFVNFNFNPFMESNAAYNDYLNSFNVVIGMSSAEGWGLPEFQAVGLGKHSVILNSTGYKEWATADNSVLVEPNGKVDIYDNYFFIRGTSFNQGQGDGWSEDDFNLALDHAIHRSKQNPINEAGLKLQQDFTWEVTTNKILSLLEEIS